MNNSTDKSDLSPKKSIISLDPKINLYWIMKIKGLILAIILIIA